MRAALCAASLSLAMPAMASDFRLAFPLDCTLNADCYIQQYVDHDPGPGRSDFRCSTLSYDGHKGTDFALPDIASMLAGVDVHAVALGRVDRLRDGVPDTGRAGMPDGQDCGNGLVLQHFEGWTTQYCHLKEGSLRVKRGDLVQPGDVLGEVGYSGATEFPHVHLTVRKDGKVIDPFVPNGPDNCTAGDQLWEEPIAYRAGGLLSLGFATGVPEYATIKQGRAALHRLEKDAPALVLWAFGFGARMGDQMRITISGPTGKVIDQTMDLDRPQAQFFRATGRRLSGAAWPQGTYTGTAHLIRDGDILETRTTTIVRD